MIKTLKYNECLILISRCRVTLLKRGRSGRYDCAHAEGRDQTLGEWYQLCLYLACISYFRLTRLKLVPPVCLVSVSFISLYNYKRRKRYFWKNKKPFRDYICFLEMPFCRCCLGEIGKLPEWGISETERISSEKNVISW